MATVMHDQSEVSTEIAERRARRFWVSFVCLLLGANLAMGGLAVYLASSDPSLSIIPNYYQKGLDWDKTKAVLVETERTGWAVDIAVTPDLPNVPQRVLTVTIKDRDGNPVEGAQGTLTLFHHAHAREEQVISLEPREAGVYCGNAVMIPEGNWDFTLVLTKGSEKYMWLKTIPLFWVSRYPQGTP